MKTYSQLVNDTLSEITEIFPWDLEEKLAAGDDVLLIDIREPYEFDAMRVTGSLNVPRGILESACDWGYQETVPELAAARDREVVVMCKSGNRSVLAAKVMELMGFDKVVSLKTGLKGWNDYELPLCDCNGNPVDIDEAEEFFADKVTREQLGPKAR
ncbi:MAG: rhodanese-like domain-containing protein [Gammaproteobacteria bacterium]